MSCPWHNIFCPLSLVPVYHTPYTTPTAMVRGRAAADMRGCLHVGPALPWLVSSGVHLSHVSPVPRHFTLLLPLHAHSLPRLFVCVCQVGLSLAVPMGDWNASAQQQALSGLAAAAALLPVQLHAARAVAGSVLLDVLLSPDPLLATGGGPAHWLRPAGPGDTLDAATQVRATFCTLKVPLCLG